MSLDFSVSMAICTIGSLFMLLGQWDTTAKRSEESEGQLGESLRVPPENAEDVAGGHLVHSDDITTHENESTVETSARRYSCTGWSMSTGGWVGCLCVSGGCGDYCVVWYGIT